MNRRILLAMIVLTTPGCFQGATAPARSNDRTPTSKVTPNDGTGAGSGTGSGTGTGTGSGTGSSGDEYPYGVAPDASLTYWDDTKAVFDAHCVRCHASTPTEGASDDFALSHYDDVAGEVGAYTKRDVVASRIASGSMPSGGSMPAGQRDMLLAWIAAGAPQGTPPAPVLGAEFLTPATSAETPPVPAFTVMVQFTDVPDGAYYDLYVSTDPGATSGGTQIGQDVPVTDTSTDWDYSTISTAGNYYVYLVLFDGDGSKLLSKASTGSIHIDNAGSVNHNPSVALTDVFDGSEAVVKAVYAGGVVPITYTATDPDGDPVSVKIEYSPTGTAPYTEVISGYSTGSPYNWTPGVLDGVTYRFKITATDGQGGSAFYVSQNDVGVANTHLTFAGDLEDYCSGCHAGKAEGFNSSSGTSVTAYQTTIRNYVVNGQMPKSGALPDEDKAKFQLWYWQGSN